MGPPLNLGADAKAVSETRTEHVEKNEVLIRVQAEGGATAQAQGTAGPGVSLQTGQLATAVN